MKLAHIWPVANQQLYGQESYVMILAHIVKQGLYKPENFNATQWIIMDNGLYEKAQVSTNLQDVIDIAEASNIPVNEIIIPDVANDLKATKKLFKENLSTIKKWQHKYKFMFVAQATTYEEFADAVKFINNYDLNLSVGYSKLTPLDRTSAESIKILTTCKHPIHYLGLKDSFKEILPVCTIIRGCDSSQSAFIVKNEEVDDLSDFVSYVRNGDDVDLINDEESTSKMEEVRDIVNSQLGSYGVLD